MSNSRNFATGSTEDISVTTTKLTKRSTRQHLDDASSENVVQTNRIGWNCSYLESYDDIKDECYLEFEDDNDDGDKVDDCCDDDKEGDKDEHDDSLDVDEDDDDDSEEDNDDGKEGVFLPSLSRWKQRKKIWPRRVTMISPVPD